MNDIILQSTVAEYQTLLGLDDWDIIICGHPKQETDSIAECVSILPEYKKARIEFYKEFFDSDKKIQKLAIIHELLHLSLSFWKIAIDDNRELRRLLPESFFNQLNLFIAKSEETSVEMLTRSIFKILEKK